MGEVINAFPGYEFVQGEDFKWHNMYRGTDLGMGGYVYAEPGIYYKVALLDIASLHPSSIVNLNKLGKYTQNYADLKQTRICIKHRDYEAAKKLFNGKLAPYLTDDKKADELSKALKLPLNSFYGISAATFSNPAKDSRDKNNIIALRGALFMRTLQDEVTARGFKVVHIKTDSIKIPNATPEIIQFCMDFADIYGYEFEHEATYDRMCLVNDAVYIAKYDSQGIRNKNGKHANEWTATGTQFQVPYVFKTLFSDEAIVFSDVCETKSVSKGDIYIDLNESLEAGEHDYLFVGKVGLFCPIKPGYGGGELLRYQDDKYYAVTGTKGWRWLEAETVQQKGAQNAIDTRYYDKLCKDAIDSINKYGSYEEFSGHSIPEWPLDDELPY